MLNSNSGDTPISTQFRLPSYQPERLVHVLLGDYAAVIEAVNKMAALRYCVGAAGP